MRKQIGYIITTIAILIGNPVVSQKPMQQLDLDADKNWWAGIISMGEMMPLSNSLTIDMYGNNYGNQVQPLLLSDAGDVVWSETPFQFSYENGKLVAIGDYGTIAHHKAGKSLKEAFQYANANYFNASRRMPSEAFFRVPQYNTWIELTYNQNQKDILEYAHNIIKNGMPPGILMIDDNWQEDYGTWAWHPGRFPDPKAMMEELHQLGFKVMLWVCPFVSPDSATFREMAQKDLFITSKSVEEDKAGLPTELPKRHRPKMIQWWNGVSAVLDLSNPDAVAWFKKTLDFLQSEYGIDGFKFDAGDSSYYTQGESVKPISANEHTRLFAKIGLDYPFNEYRATWKMGGQPLIQRLRDKKHTWEDLEKLVPQMGLAGIMGYPFSCPDMIGGGAFRSFLNDAEIDQELIVRSAQSHALMPMMQFSVAPWRVLNETHLNAVLNAVKLREKFSDYILKTAQESSRTGEPILRLLEYTYPHSGYANVKDQFLLGDTLLVAPVLEKGATKRKVDIPPGKWRSFTGKTIKGPKKITVSVGLDDLPYFEKLNL
ncbi:glycoside hydrolase family 31 protein [Maribacter sp. 2307ULW6-5]|uniref:glycoside hydrolase family 31 protein n=1 Tax=Maribacter sp. 2307ULW6-5 TaxID=3386275 RepID=UPI0039BCCA79